MKQYKIEKNENYFSSQKLPVILEKYLITETTDNEKYAIFKFKNLFLRELTSFTFIIEEYSNNNRLLDVQELKYDNISVDSNESFSPFRKARIDNETKYITFSLKEAIYDRISWIDNKWYYKKIKSENINKYKRLIGRFENNTYVKSNRNFKLRFNVFISLFLILICCGLLFLTINHGTKHSNIECRPGDFIYEIRPDGKIDIIGYKGYSKYIVVPNDIDGRLVHSLRGNFLQNKKIYELNIMGNGIDLSDFIIEGNQYIRSVTCDRLLNIGVEAFANCPLLYSFSANSVNDIESYAFYNCGNLNSINIYSVRCIHTHGIKDCDNLYVLKINNVKVLQSEAISYCPNINEISFDVDTFSKHGIKNLDSLVYIDMPNTILQSGNFDSCLNVATIIFKDTKAFKLGEILSLDNKDLNRTLKRIDCQMGYINKEFFESLTNLSVINIDFSNTMLEYPALKDCNLNNYINDGTFEIYNKCLLSCKEGLTDFVLPNNVDTIAVNAFSRCAETLKSISLNNRQFQLSCKSIRNLFNLEYLDLGEFGSVYDGDLNRLYNLKYLRTNLRTRNLYEYASNKSIETLEIVGNGEISDYFFTNMSELKNLIISPSVYKIANKALLYCYGLQSIKMPYFGSLDYLGVNKNILEVELLSSSDIDIISSYFCVGYNYLKKLVINPGYKIIGEQLVKECLSLDTIKIPETVYKMECPVIGKGCVKLRNVTVPFIGTANTLPTSYMFFNRSYFATVNLTINNNTFLTDSVFDVELPNIESLDFLKNISGNVIGSLRNLKNLKYLRVGGVPIKHIGELFTPIGEMLDINLVPQTLKTLIVKDCSPAPNITDCKQIENYIIFNCSNVYKNFIYGCDNIKNIYLDRNYYIDEDIAQQLSDSNNGNANLIFNYRSDLYSSKNYTVYNNIDFFKNGYQVSYNNKIYNFESILIPNEDKLRDLINETDRTLIFSDNFGEITFPYINLNFDKITVTVR